MASLVLGKLINLVVVLDVALVEFTIVGGGEVEGLGVLLSALLLAFGGVDLLKFC